MWPKLFVTFGECSPQRRKSFMKKHEPLTESPKSTVFTLVKDTHAAAIAVQGSFEFKKACDRIMKSALDSLLHCLLQCNIHSAIFITAIDCICFQCVVIWWTLINCICAAFRIQNSAFFLFVENSAFFFFVGNSAFLSATHWEEQTSVAVQECKVAMFPKFPMFPMQVSHKLKGCHVKSFSTLCCHCKSNTKCKDARIFPLCVNSDFLPLLLQRFSLFCVFSLTSPIPCMECAVNIESPKL